ncbi:MAG: hypothetical protein ACI9T7_000224 [Oleiphilaceae bacterium]|jgi:hypothetical protein
MTPNDTNKFYIPERQKYSIDKYTKSLNEINSFAYKNVYFLSNDVLSRNVSGSALLENIHSNIKPLEGKSRRALFFKRLISYYFRSSVSFLLWIGQKIAFILSGYKSKALTKKNKELTLIDTFFVASNLKKHDYRDKAYLKGLDDILERNNVDYSYLPVFYGENNPFKYLSIFKAFKKNNVDYITDYELLTIGDIGRIICFIITYPFHVLSLVKGLKKSDTITSAIKDELIFSLGQVTWRGYARYLTGRRIAKKVDSIKLISWCEYQTIHKNLYKGIRESEAKVKIFGCQFFIQFGSWVNINIPDNEIEFNITPDVILVNGPCYLKSNSNILYRIGISLRFKRLFESEVEILEDESNLKPIVLLSYIEAESQSILKLMSQSEYAHENIYVKAHPALSLASIKSLIQPNWTLVDGDLYDRLKDSNLVIVTASGSAVEAVSMGKSVIIIGNSDGITSNPMLNLGKGEIWDIVESAEDISAIKTVLMNFRFNNPSKIRQLASDYKKLLFNNATDAEVLDMFELQ